MTGAAWTWWRISSFSRCCSSGWLAAVIVGHYATALVARERDPQTPLWLFLVAAILLDFLLVIFVPGVELLLGLACVWWYTRRVSLPRWRQFGLYGTVAVGIAAVPPLALPG